MDAIPVNTLCAVPDSAFPLSCELGGLAELLDPLPEQSPLGGQKSAMTQGDKGYFPLPPYPNYPYYDWMSESMYLLPTPEEQDTDIFPLHSSPPDSFIPPSYSLPTPDTSAPSTPTHHRHPQDPELLDALSLIDDMSPASSYSSQLNQSSEVLPQFDITSPLPSPPGSNTTSVAYSPYNLTPNTFPLSPPSLPSQELASYPLSVPSEPSPLTSPPPKDHTTSSKSIVELLAEDTPTTGEETSPEASPEAMGGRAGKRRIEEEGASQETRGGRGKRRKLSKSAKVERKKEQNKKAALRYRQRKRGEVDEIEEKREKLEEQNAALKRQFEELATKVSYLKEVWREVEMARKNSRQC